MRILYFGTYSTGQGYPRNRVIIEGLKAAGAHVEEMHEEVWRERGDKAKALSSIPSGFLSALKLLRAYIRLAFRFLAERPRFDVMIVGYTGQMDVFLARLLTGKKIVLDAFISLTDTIITDRGMYKRGGMAERLLRLLDRTSCKLADRVLLDTNEHIDYFVREMDLNRDKFIRVLVGEDDTLFTPDEAADDKKNDKALEVLFFGTYLPLHGVSQIIKAAAELTSEPGIRFKLIGSGPELESAQSLAGELGCNNIEFITEWKGCNDLKSEIAQADVCLGIFGSGPKAMRVIPCKVYACLAMRKPIITSDTPAARELLVHEDNAMLVHASSPSSIAAAILKLKKDPGMRSKIAQSALRTFRAHAAPKVIGERLLEDLGVNLWNGF